LITTPFGTSNVWRYEWMSHSIVLWISHYWSSPRVLINNKDCKQPYM
jgi:hypothetical protein